MNITLKTTIAASLFFCLPFFVNAQDVEKEIIEKEVEENIERDLENDVKKETIIIRKNRPTEEKYQIEIDGEKVTVNGKPMSEFKDDDIEIIRRMDRDVFRLEGEINGAPRPPQPPMMGEYLQSVTANKAYLGVMTEKSVEGAKITDVSKESPAEKVGLQKGDIILNVEGETITGPDGLYKSVGKHKPNDKVTITYKRNNKESKTAVTLAENKEVRVFGFKNGEDFDFNIMPPRMPNAPYAFSWNMKPRLGIQAQDTEDGKGVKVLEVDSDSPAGKSGIQKDDIITQLNGESITSVEELKDSVEDIEEGDTIQATLQRNNKTQTLEVKFPKELKTIDL